MRPASRKRASVRRARSGIAYLNLGCGRHFSTEWTNVDLFEDEHVIRHPLTRPLPFESGVFAAAYSSHVIEHLTPAQGEQLMEELYRVLAPGGIVRLATPDLERICSEYLARLSAMADEPNEQNWRRYRWITLELMDQMVRDKPGGLMLHEVKSGAVERADVEARLGDELAASPEARPRHDLSARSLARAGRGIRGRVYRRLSPLVGDPRRSGEGHKWMYDRVGLRHLLEGAGFKEFRVTSFEDSRIPEWREYDLDRSRIDPHRARKPDSIFVEAIKPG